MASVDQTDARCRLHPEGKTSGAKEHGLRIANRLEQRSVMTVGSVARPLPRKSAPAHSSNQRDDQPGGAQSAARGPIGGGGLPGVIRHAIIRPMRVMARAAAPTSGAGRTASARRPGGPPHGRRRRRPRPALRPARPAERPDRPGPARGRLPGLDPRQVPAPGRPPGSPAATSTPSSVRCSRRWSPCT